MERFDRAVSVLLTVAAIVIAVVVARREMGYGPAPTIPTASQDAVRQEGWEDRLSDSNSILIGDKNAPIQIAVFFDLECPFCSRFESTVLQPLLDDLPQDVNVRLVHLPLDIHRFALPAAGALECVANPLQADRFRRLVFAKQDSLGLKSWASFAADAGVEDLGEFDVCVSAPRLPRRVQEGMDLARDLGLTGTPTILIGNWQLGIPPRLDELEAILERVRHGQEAVDVT